jgi:hypothetical protein
MYNTWSHGSPWVKMTSLRRYVTIFLATPAESRKVLASNLADLWAFKGALILYEQAGCALVNTFQLSGMDNVLAQESRI